MDAIARELACVTRRNEEIAQGGCFALEQLRASCTPPILQEIQDEIRSGIRYTMDRLKKIRSRKKHRSERIAARVRRNPGLRRKLNDHHDVLRARENALRHQQQILLQIGDACAWIVLRYNHRIIVPLADPEQNHRLPSEIGLIGPLIIADRAHESGEFLVIENDLTNTLKVGDLTVVAVNEPLCPPIAIEVKTRGEFRVGAEATTTLKLAISAEPSQERVFRRLIETLSLVEAGVDQTRDLDTQETKLKARLELMENLRNRSRVRVDQSAEKHWGVAKKLLTRVLHQCSAFEFPEHGLVYYSFRAVPDCDLRNEAHLLEKRLLAYGMPIRGEGVRRFSSGLLAKRTFYSAVVLPIALWPLPRSLRVKLLTRELVVATAFQRDLWSRLFQALGVSINIENGAWHLQKGTFEAVVEPVEVLRIEGEVGLLAASPRSIAELLAITLVSSAPGA
jgi:hypothetical protein